MLLVFLQMLEKETDRILFASLYEEYQEKMFWIAFKYLKNSALAEECVNDAFLELIKSFEIFIKLEQSKRPYYLFTITERCAFKKYHQEKKQHDISDPDFDLFIPDASMIRDEYLSVPKIVPEQAEVVREIYDRFLDGLSLDQIQQHLQSMQAVSMNGGTSWNKKTIDSILKNEKYAGDLLLQKTFIADPISKKTKKNRGELPKYLVSNNHPAIIPREKFNAVQMEIARRGSKHKRSGKTKTEQGKYSGKYALSELLICGECGNHFKRNGKKNPDGTYTYYWRCINRSENGRKACSCGGLEEKKLQKTICECLNEMFTRRDETVRLLRENLRFAVSDNDVDSDVYQMERQIVALQEEAESWMHMVSTTTGDTGKYYELIQINFDRVRNLRQQIEFARCRTQTDAAVNDEVNRLTHLFDSENVSFEEFDDVIIRRLVECIRVMPKDRVILTTKGGLQIERQS